MGMRMKLRDYRAEVRADPEERRLRTRTAIATTVCVTLPLLVVVSVVGRGQAAGTRPGADVALKRTVQARSGSPNIVRSENQEFVYSNWGHLRRSGQPPQPPPASPDEGLESPDWSGIEVYKELRGLAVYEVREGAERSAAPARTPEDDLPRPKAETRTEAEAEAEAEAGTDEAADAERPPPAGLPVPGEEGRT